MLGYFRGCSTTLKLKTCKISIFISLSLNLVVVIMLILYRKYTIIDNKVKKNLKSTNVFFKTQICSFVDFELAGKCG